MVCVSNNVTVVIVDSTATRTVDGNISAFVQSGNFFGAFGAASGAFCITALLRSAASAFQNTVKHRCFALRCTHTAFGHSTALGVSGADGHHWVAVNVEYGLVPPAAAVANFYSGGAARVTATSIVVTTGACCDGSRSLSLGCGASSAGGVVSGTSVQLVSLCVEAGLVGRVSCGSCAGAGCGSAGGCAGCGILFLCSAGVGSISTSLGLGCYRLSTLLTAVGLVCTIRNFGEVALRVADTVPNHTVSAVSYSSCIWNRCTLCICAVVNGR